jgi:predicted FMN-binding regulatory protein PaiB
MAAARVEARKRLSQNRTGIDCAAIIDDLSGDRRDSAAEMIASERNHPSENLK